MTPTQAPSARRATAPAEARALVDETLRALDALGETVAAETELMQAGRIRDALALTPAKQERAGGYMRLLESVKANAIALARFAPDGIEALKTRHVAFSDLLRLNQLVIGTVKLTSETLMRDLQREATAPQTLSVYGPGAAAAAKGPASRAPLTLSVRL